MGNFIKNKRVIFCLIVGGILITNSAVLAFQNWPPSPLGTGLTEDSTLSVLIKYLYEWGVALGGLAVFIVLVWAGFQYLTSTGDPTKMKDAMSRIKSAVLGLVLLLASVLILNTINPALTTLQPLSLNLEELQGGLSCQGDEDCGENWQCKEGKCVPVIDLKVTQCESVTLYTESGRSGVFALDANLSFQINAGESFGYETVSQDPEKKCMGILELYPSSFWSWCRGDKHTIYVSGMGEAHSPEATQCVVLRGVPEI